MGVNSIFLRAVIADVDIAFAGCCSNASGPCNNLVVNGYIACTGSEGYISLIGCNQIVYRNNPISGFQGCILPGCYVSANMYVSISGC